MARIIRLHDDSHWELQRLLPWYVTDRLDPTEHARVEAHLAGCEECREEVLFERTLAKTVKDLPLDAEVGWRRLERRLKVEPRRGGVLDRSAAVRTGALWGGWAVAACALVAVGVTVLPRQQSSGAAYHALGAPHSVTPGNMVVIFRPDTSERAIRAALTSVGARIVDGPTGADAYVLQAPPAQQAQALAQLRSRPNIVLAEPVDPGATP
jgi:hypothetical protein